MRVLLITPESPFIKAFRRRQLNNFVQLTMPYLAAFVRPPVWLCYSSGRDGTRRSAGSGPKLHLAGMARPAE